MALQGQVGSLVGFHLQDARVFVQSLQYWLGGNADNLENLVLNVASAYTPALKGLNFSIADPQLFPDVGLWHPLAPGQDIAQFATWLLRTYKQPSPVHGDTSRIFYL